MVMSSHCGSIPIAYPTHAAPAAATVPARRCTKRRRSMCWRGSVRGSAGRTPEFTRRTENQHDTKNRVGNLERNEVMAEKTQDDRPRKKRDAKDAADRAPCIDEIRRD